MTTRHGSNDAVRHTLQVSADPRAARTRATILDAVSALADGSEEISVSAIARAAGVSRASFYSHYASLDELANSLRRDAFFAIRDLYLAESHETADALLLSQERLVQHFADNRALYSAAAALPVSKESYLAGARSMAAVIEETLAEHPRLPDGLQPAATARYIAGAAYGLLDAWILDEIVLTEGELVHHLTALLPPWFSGTH